MCVCVLSLTVQGRISQTISFSNNNMIKYLPRFIASVQFVLEALILELARPSSVGV